MQEKQQIHLLKKSRKTFFELIFSRLTILFILLIIQVLFLLSCFAWFEESMPHILGGTTIFTIFMVLYIFSSDVNASEKMTWLILIMIMPITGGMFYIYTKSEVGHRLLSKMSVAIEKRVQTL